jgi:hypothetical protein
MGDHVRNMGDTSPIGSRTTPRQTITQVPISAHAQPPTGLATRHHMLLRSQESALPAYTAETEREERARREEEYRQVHRCSRAVSPLSARRPANVPRLIVSPEQLPAHGSFRTMSNELLSGHRFHPGSAPSSASSLHSQRSTGRQPSSLSILRPSGQPLDLPGNVTERLQQLTTAPMFQEDVPPRALPRAASTPTVTIA